MIRKAQRIKQTLLKDGLIIKSMSKPTIKKRSKKPVAKKRAYRVVMPKAKKSNGGKILLALWVGLALVQSVVIYGVYGDQFKEVADMVIAYAS